MLAAEPRISHVTTITVHAKQKMQTTQSQTQNAIHKPENPTNDNNNTEHK